MSIVKSATNRMTAYLDALKTVAEKNRFRGMIHAAANNPDHLSSTALKHGLVDKLKDSRRALHRSINERAGVLPRPMIRSKEQMARGIYGHAAEKFRNAGYEIKELGRANEISSGVSASSKYVRLPKNNGKFDSASVAFHEGNELSEGVRDKGYIHSAAGHHNFAVLGHDSNMLSRSFYTDPRMHVMRLGEESTYFKQLSGKDFGTKVNRTEMNALRQSSEKGFDKANQSIYPGKALLARLKGVEAVRSEVRKHPKIINPNNKEPVMYNVNLNNDRKPKIFPTTSSPAKGAPSMALNAIFDRRKYQIFKDEFLKDTLDMNPHLFHGLKRKEIARRAATAIEASDVKYMRRDKIQDVANNMKLRQSFAKKMALQYVPGSYFSKHKRLPLHKRLMHQVGERSSYSPTRLKAYDEYKALAQNPEKYYEKEELRKKFKFPYIQANLENI